MASVLPAFTRSWQISPNEICAANATADTQVRTYLLVMKNRLKGAGSGWLDATGASVASPTGGGVIKSSSNGTAFGNNDSVDRITVGTDFVFSGGSHTWFTMRFASIYATFEILFDCGSNNSNGTIKCSHTGFGAANGGVDGTLSVAPTALNSVTLLNAGSPGSTSTVSTQTILNVWLAADGKSIRLEALRNAHSCALMFLESVSSPEPGWVTPYSACWVGTGVAAPSTEVLSATNLINGTSVFGFGSASIAELFDIPQGGGSTLYTLITTSNSFTANYPFWGLGLFSTTASNAGRLGVLVDFYLGLATFATGDTYPNAAPFDQIKHVNGPFIWPWPRVVPVNA